MRNRRDRQDFRTSPYSLCSNETIGITIVRRWDYFALFLLVFIFSFLVDMGFADIFEFLLKNTCIQPKIFKFLCFLHVVYLIRSFKMFKIRCFKRRDRPKSYAQINVS